jgi:microcompartment protein CcmK/EutM
MFVGKVIGTVWSTVKWPQLAGHKLLLVRPYHLNDLAELAALSGRQGSPPQSQPEKSEDRDPDPRREAVVCIDLLDAGVGDNVIVAFGHAARVAAHSMESSAAAGTTTPIDAAVVAIVEGAQVQAR